MECLVCVTVTCSICAWRPYTLVFSMRGLPNTTFGTVNMLPTPSGVSLAADRIQNCSSTLNLTDYAIVVLASVFIIWNKVIYDQIKIKCVRGFSNTPGCGLVWFRRHKRCEDLRWLVVLINTLRVKGERTFLVRGLLYVRSILLFQARNHTLISFPWETFAAARAP